MVQPGATPRVYQSANWATTAQHLAGFLVTLLPLLLSLRICFQIDLATTWTETSTVDTLLARVTPGRRSTIRDHEHQVGLLTHS
jgi:hypothetical protein